MKKKLSKLTKEQEAIIYCVKNGHANYVWKFWGYVHCGRCGKQIGDQLGSVFDTRNIIVIGCAVKNCKVCPSLVKKLSKLDKKIHRRVSAMWKNGFPDYKKILRDIDFE